MQVSLKEVNLPMELSAALFFIAPVCVVIYLLLNNRKKSKYEQEKVTMQKNYENELLLMQMEVQDQTLKTVAYNLHDNIGQLLSLTAIILSSINLNDTVKAAQKITTVEDLTKRSMKEVKALSKLLHGEEILITGLTAAIEAELLWLQKSERYKISFTKHADIKFAADSKTIIVFRLFQEIINNIIQHAGATEIFITLEEVEGLYKIIMRDNGIGFKVNETIDKKRGLGLQNINRRINMINGTVFISSIPDGGTLIILNIPTAD